MQPSATQGNLISSAPSPASQSPSVHLGSQMAFEDARPESSLRGLLFTPPAVEVILNGQPDRLAAMPPRVRQRFRDDLNLSYYFGGREVAFRQTDRGIEVLAVGRKEIEELKRKLSPAELLDVVEEEVRPW